MESNKHSKCHTTQPSGGRGGLFKRGAGRRNRRQYWLFWQCFYSPPLWNYWSTQRRRRWPSVLSATCLRLIAAFRLCTHKTISVPNWWHTKRWNLTREYHFSSPAEFGHHNEQIAGGHWTLWSGLRAAHLGGQGHLEDLSLDRDPHVVGLNVHG